MDTGALFWRSPEDGGGGLPQWSAPAAPTLSFPPPNSFSVVQSSSSNHYSSQILLLFLQTAGDEGAWEGGCPWRCEWALLMWNEPGLWQDTLRTGVVSFLPPVASFPVAEQWPLTQAVIFSLVTPAGPLSPPLAPCHLRERCLVQWLVQPRIPVRSLPGTTLGVHTPCALPCARRRPAHLGEGILRTEPPPRGVPLSPEASAEPTLLKAVQGGDQVSRPWVPA